MGERDEPPDPQPSAAPERAYDPERARTEKSFGVGGAAHWARQRKDLHREEIEFLRERSRAPGVAEGGALRNHYCLECHGVIPLEYDSRESAEGRAPERCPHCGAELGGGVRMMFNWVELDQVPGSDLRALLPFLIAGGLALLGLGVLLWQLFGS
jgi:hypothetical protein